MSDKILWSPDQWAALYRIRRPTATLSGIRADTRTRVVTPHTAEWLAGRELFANQWEAIIETGLEAGYLENEPCYECSGSIELTTDLVTVTYTLAAETQ